MTEQFADGRIVLHGGDCLQILPTLDECSIDACVTDPPYHLTSIVKRFGADNAAPAKFGKDGAYSRASAGFMGRKWDGGNIAFRPETWAAVYRVLKPGAHLLAFGGTRTFHRMAVAIEDAGFEIRDTILWLYGSGFPKSHDVSKAIDRAAGAEREVIGRYASPEGTTGLNSRDDEYGFGVGDMDKRLITAPATAAARQWEGWGTALKPSAEMICLARKPLSEKTVAANVLRWGTGALNINGCRVPTEGSWERERCRCHLSVGLAESSPQQSTLGIRESTAINNAAPTSNGRGSASPADTDKMGIGCSDGMMAESSNTSLSMSKSGKTLTGQSRMDLKSTTSTTTGETTTSAICKSCGKPIIEPITSENTTAARKSLRPGESNSAHVAPAGRWPANCIHDGSEEVVRAFPDGGAHGQVRRQSAHKSNSRGDFSGVEKDFPFYGDSGSAARFFYCAKANKKERTGSKHPTVKPIKLIQYLIRLVTPSGGIVLDPFGGSGTTGEAANLEKVRAVLIEREAEYQNDISRRFQQIELPDEFPAELEDLPLFKEAS